MIVVAKKQGRKNIIMTDLEYSKHGLVGVLTPQANTTVEPEFRILWPAGVSMINARLTSSATTMVDRLFEYVDQIDETLNRFANAPVDLAAFGCTGASYLIGKEKEQALCEKIERLRGYPFITAARAVTDTLATLEAKTIGLVSPYPAELTEQSVDYWKSAGYKVGEVACSWNDKSDFHPIYSLSATNAHECLLQLENKNLDAIVMLGTGMPTLDPIIKISCWNGPPVTSCMLSLAWRTSIHLFGIEPKRRELINWLTGIEWKKRMTVLHPSYSD